MMNQPYEYKNGSHFIQIFHLFLVVELEYIMKFKIPLSVRRHTVMPEYSRWNSLNISLLAFCTSVAV